MEQLFITINKLTLYTLTSIEHILYTALHKFLMLLKRRIFLTFKLLLSLLTIFFMVILLTLWAAISTCICPRVPVSPCPRVKDGAHRAEMKARAEATIKRGTRKKRQRSDQEATNYICSSCNKDCHSRIGLLSHSRAHQHWCADHRLSETRMPLSTCIFSSLFSICFIIYGLREFVQTSRHFIFGNHFILVICTFDQAVILFGEIRCWSLLGLKGLMLIQVWYCRDKLDMSHS